jgi:hypothetical protein
MHETVLADFPHLRRSRQAIIKLTNIPPELPEWLIGTPVKEEKLIPTEEARKLLEVQYSNMFNSLIDRVTMGESLKSALNEDTRKFDYALFLRWIFKNEKRRNLYYEAQAVGAEVKFSEILDLAEAKDSFEDIQRSSLRINTTKYHISVANRKRFGEVKQVEHSGTISIKDAMEQANTRVIDLHCLDNPPVDVDIEACFSNYTVISSPVDPEI